MKNTISIILVLIINSFASNYPSKSIEVKSKVEFLAWQSKKCQPDLRLTNFDSHYYSSENLLVTSESSYKVGCYEGFDSGTVTIRAYDVDSNGIKILRWQLSERGTRAYFGDDFIEIHIPGCCASSRLNKVVSISNGKLLGKSSISPLCYYNRSNKQDECLLFLDNSTEDNDVQKGYFGKKYHVTKKTILDSSNVVLSRNDKFCTDGRLSSVYQKKNENQVPLGEFEVYVYCMDWENGLDTIHIKFYNK